MKWWVHTISDGSLASFPGNNQWDPDTLAVFGLTPCLPLGKHTVTYTVEDACGNTSTCSYTLTVDDQTPPVVACDQHYAGSPGRRRYGLRKCDDLRRRLMTIARFGTF
jgi:hypothetical protein